MLHIDYHWDLGPNYIKLDDELNTDRLQWQVGDYWQIVESDGKLMFQKVDPMIKFLIEGQNSGRS